MYFVIDVICAVDRPRVIQFWKKHLQTLTGCNGFVAAEFFLRQQDLRNADYDFLLLYQWRDAEACRQALWQGAMPAQVPGQQIERAYYEIAIELAKAQAADEHSSWLINPFEITVEQMPDVLDMWDKAKDHMQAKAGFQHARLLRATHANARYGLVNVAQWQSAEHFIAALDDKAYDRHKQRSLQYQLHPSLCKRLAFVSAETAAAGCVA